MRERSTLGGAVTGNGQITINPGTGLELGQTSASTQRIVFTGNSGALKLDQPGAFKSPIANFQAGDVIDFAGLGATAALYSAGDLILFNGTIPVAQLTVSTPYSRQIFPVSPDGSGGTDVTVQPIGPADRVRLQQRSRLRYPVSEHQRPAGGLADERHQPAQRSRWSARTRDRAGTSPAPATSTATATPTFCGRMPMARPRSG
jgi:hypothetical protein